VRRMLRKYAFTCVLLYVTAFLPARHALIYEFSVSAYAGLSGTDCDANHRCTVTITDVQGGISITGTLTGLMANMIAPMAGVKNSYGYHIHVNDSCENGAAAGAHYYPGMSTDPWSTVTWASGPSGVASIATTMSNFSLTGVNPVAGRAFVLHDMSGARIACGLIPSSSSPPSSDSSSWDVGVAISILLAVLVSCALCIRILIPCVCPHREESPEHGTATVLAKTGNDGLHSLDHHTNSSY